MLHLTNILNWSALVNVIFPNTKTTSPQKLWHWHQLPWADMGNARVRIHCREYIMKYVSVLLTGFEREFVHHFNHNDTLAQNYCLINSRTNIYMIKYVTYISHKNYLLATLLSAVTDWDVVSYLCVVKIWEWSYTFDVLHSRLIGRVGNWHRGR